MEPVLPQTFETALRALGDEHRLHERVARETLAKLVSALVDGEHDGALPDVLPTWMRRIAEALVAEDFGFVTADLWLLSPEPLMEKWPPALLAEATRLRQELVPAAEKAHDAKWGLEPRG